MPLLMKSIKQGISNKAKRQGWIDTDLWERGGGYDRNIFSEKARLKAIGYIHRNPDASGLVDDLLSYRLVVGSLVCLRRRRRCCMRLFLEPFRVIEYVCGCKSVPA